MKSGSQDQPLAASAADRISTLRGCNTGASMSSMVNKAWSLRVLAKGFDRAGRAGENALAGRSQPKDAAVPKDPQSRAP